MIKDPLHNEETPYDLLDLDPDAPHKDVLPAFQRFLTNPENRAKIQKGQEASRRLNNFMDRIAVDILYYCTEQIGAEANDLPDLESGVEDLKIVPFMNENDMSLELNKEDILDDFREISFSDINIEELREYDNFPDYKLETSFDK